MDFVAVCQKEQALTEQLKKFHEIAIKGQMFLKYTGKRRRKPQDRIIKVSFDNENKPKTISWGSGSRYIPFDEILYISWGHYTPIFEARKDQLDAELCLSIVGKQQILDLQAENKEIAELWVKGLRQLIGHTDETSDKLAKQTLANYDILETENGATPRNDDEKVNTFKNITLSKHEISAIIKNRYAIITYLFNFENMNENGSDELKFEITIDPNAFISKFEANIDGEIFHGITKEKQMAAKEYSEAKEQDENAIMLSQPHQDIPNVFEIKTNIDAKSKILLTITIEQYIQKKCGFNEVNIQILREFDKYNIYANIDSISFRMDVEDNGGIYDVDIPIISKDDDIVVDDKIMDKLEQNCRIYGKIMCKSSINELRLKYKIKGEADDSCILFDDKSNTFCHIISNVITDSIIMDNILIPRRVIFVIDKSGSMRGDKWNKTISSTIMAIKQLRKSYDKFGIILFSNVIELLPYKDQRGCMSVDDKTVSDSIAALQEVQIGGSTNINASLLKAIEMIKIDILLTNNDKNAVCNYYMNQIIFITDGKPNNGQHNTNKIIMNIKNANDLSKIDKYNKKICIFSFGVGQDGNDSEWVNDLNHSFLKILSLNNNGWYQRIKQTSADTAFNQYFTILSKPVVTNINVEYKNKNITNLTKKSFVTLYLGNDLIICGKIDSKLKIRNYRLNVTISAVTGNDDKLTVKPINIYKEIKINISSDNNNNNGNNTERIWAYLKLQQLATKKLLYNDMIEMDQDEEKENTALSLALALKYKFVTPWTSMIVVKKKDEQQQHPMGRHKSIRNVSKEHQKRTKNLMLLQQDLFVMCLTTVFRNLEDERIWYIDDSIKNKFDSKLLYELAIKEDVAWRQWNDWIRDKIVTYLNSFGTKYVIKKSHNNDDRKQVFQKEIDINLLNRIKNELKELEINPISNCMIKADNDDPTIWNVTINGAENTPYNGGIFKLEIEIIDQYPAKPPKCTFITKIYHQNVDENGQIGLDILINKNNLWSAYNMNIKKLLLIIIQLFIKPNTTHILMTDIANLYISNKIEHDKIAKQWTEQYAKQCVIQ